MNYSTLKADVANYLHRSDLTTPIVVFIEHARLKLGNDLRALANQATGTVTSFSSGRAALPSNLAALISVTQGTRRLQWVPADQVVVATGDVYSVDGGELIVPGAESSDSVDLSYWVIPAPLVNNTDVSEGMDELPHVWRYAAVIEGAIYIQDWELLAQMQQLYTDAVLAANAACRDARFPKGPTLNDQAANVYAGGTGL